MSGGLVTFCSYCSAEVKQLKGDIKRALKEGRNIYCTRECYKLARTTGRKPRGKEVTKGQARAAQQVRKAILNDALDSIKEDTKCVDCGEQAKEYDHRDYNKPLEVEPVCGACNQKRGPAIPWDGVRAKRRWTKKTDPEKIKSNTNKGRGYYFYKTRNSWCIAVTINKQFISKFCKTESQAKTIVKKLRMELA